MKITPVNGRILVLVSTKNSNIVLPDGATNPEAEISVLAVAADCKVPIAVGDRILTIPGSNACLMEKNSNGEVALIHEGAVMAIDRRTALNFPPISLS